MRLFLKLFISTILTKAYADLLSECDNTLRNICGSDMKLYKSECDFLNAKSNNSDLLIVDITDCISTNLNDKFNNSSFDNINISINRSLRGSNVTKNNFKHENSGIIYNSTENQIEMDNYLHLNSNKTHNSLYKIEIGSDNKINKFSNYTNDYFLNPRIEESRLFKNITENNVKLINVLIQKFDISTFILSNGRYNLLRLSRLILDTIMRIMNEYRSNIRNRRQNEKMNINNDLKNKTEFYNFDNKLYVENSSIVNSKELYDGLNITIKFSNKNASNEFSKIPYITNLALDVIQGTKIKRNNFYNITDIANNTMNNSHVNEYINRSLIEVKPGDLYLDFENNSNEFFSQNSTNNSRLNNKNCNLDLENYSNVSKSIGFYCIFKDEQTDFEKIQDISEMTELVLAKYFENHYNYNITQDYFRTLSSTFNVSIKDIYDYIPYARSLTNEHNLINSKFRENLEINFPSSEITVNDYMSDINAYELYVSFDFNALNDDLYINNNWNNTVEENLDEYNDILIENNSSNKTFNQDNFVNYRFDSRLMNMISEKGFFNKNNTGFTIDELFRDFPGAFDRKRGEGCIIECGDEQDYHCANNGVTYLNLCEFRNAQCENKNLIFVSYGRCVPLLIRG